MNNEYHAHLHEFLADLVPHLRERGQHHLADRAERLQQDLPVHDAAETVWQQRRKLLESIDLTEL